MKKEIYVSVSTDPIKEYQKVVDYAKEMQDKADFLHCDVMDGVFVDNKTYDFNVIQNINNNSLIMLDVHLMTNEPFDQIVNYIDAGANILTVHYEAFKNKENLTNALLLIKKKKALVGLSVKPQTPFKEFKMFCFDIDLLLVMSVEPGKSGQKFMPEVLNKIKEVDKFRRENNLKFKIEVDGGINQENAAELIAAGVNILVSGSYVYNSKDKQEAINSLKG